MREAWTRESNYPDWLISSARENAGTSVEGGEKMKGPISASPASCTSSKRGTGDGKNVPSQAKLRGERGRPVEPSYDYVAGACTAAETV